MKTITISRSGQFSLAVIGDFHCGVNGSVENGRVDVKYTITAIATDSLDERGFLFDQGDLNDWLQERANKPSPDSCEIYAEKTAVAFLEWVHAGNAGAHIIDLAVAFSPAPFVATLTIHDSSVAHYARQREKTIKPRAKKTTKLPVAKRKVHA